MSKCFECGAPGDHQHHVVPQSLGGTQTVWLCERHHGIVHERGGMVGHRALTKAGLARERAKGVLTTGIPPYGFCRFGLGSVLVVPHPAEQATIAAARRWRAQGLSLRAVAVTLEELGHKSRTGRRFAPSAIESMCRVTDTPPVNPEPQPAL